MERLFGSRGGATRQDVLVAADADLFPVSGKDYGARVLYRKPEKQSDVKWGKEKGSRTVKD